MKRALTRNLWIAGAVLVTLCASFYVYVCAEKRIDRANDRRNLMASLADQLRHSSDDLTRMVRTYVVTGNPVYKQAFQDIFDIRDGRKQAPPDYVPLYWDLQLLDGRAPSFAADGGQPLMEAIRAAGVSAEEMAKLTEAKANSDALAALEAEAMRLVEADGPDAAAKRAQAVAIVHGERYHQAKAAIMRPIAEFYRMMDARTLAEVREAETTAMLFRIVFIVFTAGAVVLLWRARAELRATLGGSADEVYDHITRIGAGDLSRLPAAQAGAENSVLGRLADMQSKLQAIQTARQLAVAELSEKNEALARSNAELEAFAYVASHDLREPLRNVTAFSTLLARRLEGRLDADDQEALNILTGAATRMDSLVRDLLEVSRVGRDSLPSEAVSLGKVVAAALDSLRMQIDAAGAIIQVPSDLPEVMGNADELYRVFLNVIGNALKYRRDDSLVVTIACRPDGDRVWRFDVSDNGIGIETGQGYEERIFGLFQRLHQRDEHGGGTGIGLTLCRKIVNHHGGRMWAESAGLGHGTTIAFTLPRRAADAAEGKGRGGAPPAV